MKLTCSIFFTLIFAFTKGASELPVKKGQFQIISEDLSRNNIVAMCGEWEFYWNRLLSPDSFLTRQVTPQYQTVPKKWQHYNFKGASLPIRGFATYRITIANPDQLSDLAIKVHGIATACKIWVNGDLKVARGMVATNAAQSRAERLHNFVKLPDTETIDIVIQASNYEYSVPGIAQPVLIGHEADLMGKDRLENNFEMIEIGCLLLMIFYHLALYFQIGKNPSYLLFSILCAAVLVRTTATYHSSLLLFRLFPGIDFVYIKKFEFGVTYATIMLLPMFIRSLFPYEATRLAIRIFQVSSCLLTLVVVVTPPYTFGQSLGLFNIALSTSFVYALWVIANAIRNKRQDAWLMFAGLFICMVFVQFEMLRVADIIPHDLLPIANMTGVGIISFLLFQSIALALRFSRAFKDVADLTYTLEKRVEKRTEELSRANLVKDKLFSIISHDLLSPLNSLKGLLDLTTKEHLRHNDLQRLLPPIHQNLAGSLQLLDNLLSWASSQMKGMNAKPDRISLSPLVEENIALYKTIAKNKNIRLVNHTGAIEVLADPNMTKLIIRNLVSNAIKFTPDGGSVEVSATTSHGQVEICVADTGVGIPNEFKERIFEVDINRTTRGTNDEKGTGIGLLLCREFIEKNGGKLWVESEFKEGAKFKFTLPSPSVDYVYRLMSKEA